MSTDPEIAQQINAAIGAHGAWKMKLKTAINLGRADVAPAEVRRDDCCAFGKWIHSNDLSAATRAGKPYQVVRRLHAEFHQCAASILDHAISGRQGEAEGLFSGEYAERSKKLVQALTKWKRELTT